MRLIDADALIEQYKAKAADEWNKKVAPMSWAAAWEEIIDDIEDAPTVEQESVKPDRPEEVWRCGNCGEIVGWDDFFRSEDDVHHNYCPKCGRKVKWGD